ncbi:MAG: histidinol-phosphate transaminase [Thermodesulfobacteriota bacterium]
MDPLSHVKDLIPYVPGKPVEELEREYGIKDSIKIASNENPLGPSQLAIKAVKEALINVHRYPDGDSFYLKEKLASFLDVKSENLIIGNGSNEVIEIVARTYLSPDDEAIYGEHAFIVYPIVTQAIGARHVVSPMPDLIHDLKDIESRISGKTRIIFLANPNNPTGTIFNRVEFEWFLSVVPDDVLIIADEAYFEYVNDEDYPNSLEYHNEYPNLITVRTFSKVYGLAGLRLGYAVASEKIISYVNRVREPFNVNSLAQVAAIAALDDHEHVTSTNEINQIGMKFLEQNFTDLDINFIKSYTNFILIDLKIDPMPVYNKLLKEGVIVRPVGGYGLKTHLRITIGTEEENNRFITALKKVLDK